MYVVGSLVAGCWLVDWLVVDKLVGWFINYWLVVIGGVGGCCSLVGWLVGWLNG